jgi:hypothetical protein
MFAIVSLIESLKFAAEKYNCMKAGSISELVKLALK